MFLNNCIFFSCYSREELAKSQAEAVEGKDAMSSEREILRKSVENLNSSPGKDDENDKVSLTQRCPSFRVLEHRQSVLDHSNLLKGAVQTINLNIVTRWHYHISFVTIIKTYIINKLIQINGLTDFLKYSESETFNRII